MIRTSTLDDVGNLSAPPGTRDWAVAIRLDIQSTLNDVKGDAQHLQAMVSLIVQHKGYRQLTDQRGRPFATYESFCVERQPFGLGYGRADIDRIIGERKDAQAKAQAPLKLADHGGDRRSEEATQTPDQDNHIILKTGESIPSGPRVRRQGTDSDYLTARIARDHPAILDRMKAGEFKSVRAAALEAGIVRPTMTLPLDPERAAKLILSRFTGNGIEPLMRELCRLCGLEIVEESWANLPRS